MILKGRIIKGIGGFYYVDAATPFLYECRARGVFRKKGQNILVGDMVDIEPTSEDETKAFLVGVHERKSELIRPAVANADLAVLIFSACSPDPNPGLIDRFLVNMEIQKMETVLCLSKIDLVNEDEIEKIVSPYRDAGYHVITFSSKTQEGIDEIKDYLKGRMAVLSGPSGVGKSSLINSLLSENKMEVGGISEKIGRGRNTTRHAEVIKLMEDTFVIDTPGYSSIDVLCQEETELDMYFKEFGEFLGNCRFRGCVHIAEPDCAVRDGVQQGKITEIRYNSYKEIYESIKSRRRW